MRKLVLIILLLVAGFNTKAQIKWMGFSEAFDSSATIKRKVFVDVYTDWCSWCKVMDKKTFTDSTVADLLNKHFHTVKLDAESKETIKFRGHEFKFNPTYKSNELAVSLLNGQMSYPSVVFLDDEFRLITVVPGYQKPENIIPMLKYIGEDHFKTLKWDDFIKQYNEEQK